MKKVNRFQALMSNPAMIADGLMAKGKNILNSRAGRIITDMIALDERVEHTNRQGLMLPKMQQLAI
ncbi:hypothetical protein [Alkalicoccobacillus murimartini]|uniref:Uncharacterized protein n=1 Tax=Alkalicoccobacillus murimartini TaxID=171685 RepID=A0ABT9YKA8_9BACI|nr:hypothetical protein [Alkalicoccobacillus murimartini]MDQ0208297.1 hypothetical protein [Alkalicoccobacillus murimartini]